MTVRYSTGCLNKLLGSQDLQTQFANGVIEFYSGAQPSSADAAVTGTLLAVASLDPDSWAENVATYGLEFDEPVLAVMSKAAAEVWKYKGLVAGTIGYFRLRGLGLTSESATASTTLSRIDGSVGTTSGDMTISNITPAVGAPGTVDIFTITLS